MNNDSAAFKISGRDARLLFSSEEKRLRLDVCIFFPRDKSGRVKDYDNPIIYYSDVSITVTDAAGKQVPCVGAAKAEEAFDGVFAGIGSWSGAYWLPPIGRDQLLSASVSWAGDNVNVSLKKLKKGR